MTARPAAAVDAFSVAATQASRRIALRLHLLATALGGTAAHLRREHRLPEGLIDSDDPHGLGADHACLHGAHALPSGGIGFGPHLRLHSDG